MIINHVQVARASVSDAWGGGLTNRFAIAD